MLENTEVHTEYIYHSVSISSVRTVCQLLVPLVQMEDKNLDKRYSHAAVSDYLKSWTSNLQYLTRFLEPRYDVHMHYIQYSHLR